MATIEIKPLHVSQESRDGDKPNPEFVAANWDYQTIGLVFPAVDVVVTGAWLEMELAPAAADYVINQRVTLCEPHTEGAPPSQWTAVAEALALDLPGKPGAVATLPLVHGDVMSHDGWGVAIHTNTTGRMNNLRAMPATVRLVVEYADTEPEPPEEPDTHNYEVVRQFKPGDVVTVRLTNMTANGTEEIGMMQFTMPGAANGD